MVVSVAAIALASENVVGLFEFVPIEQAQRPASIVCVFARVVNAIASQIDGSLSRQIQPNVGSGGESVSTPPPLPPICQRVSGFSSYALS